MKVAIIGAGLAGLSCAYLLEKYGINPTIFEKRDYVGDALLDAAAALNIFNRMHECPEKYFRKKYGIRLKPEFHVHEIVMKSESKETTVKGKLGNIFLRGRNEKSLEKQIADYIKTPVNVKNYAKINDIKNEFDYIVSATGEESIAKELGVWKGTFNARVRVATVIGDIKTDSITMWINSKYCKNGFCYMVPNSAKQASLILIANNITRSELDFYWKQFLLNEQLPYTIIETRDFESNVGIVRRVQVDNIYLTGNAGGFTDSFLGFGTLNAVESGLLAARSIAGKGSFEELTRPIAEHVKNINEFRKAFDTFDNKDMDRLLSVIGLPGVKQFLYGNSYFKAVQGSFLVKAFNELKKKT